MSRRNRRTRLALSRKVKLYWAQHGFCAGCGGKMPRLGEKCHPHDYPTQDHVVCKSAGGKDDFTNLLLMHMICNARKRNTPPTVRHLVILEYVQERLALLHGLLRNGQKNAPEVREVYDQHGAVIFDFGAEVELRAKTARKRKPHPRMKDPRRLAGFHS